MGPQRIRYQDIPQRIRYQDIPQRIRYQDIPPRQAAQYARDQFVQAWDPPGRRGVRTITNTPPRHERLMELPKKITDEDIMLAWQILGDGEPMFARHHENTRGAYVQLAVEKQWRIFTPVRFIQEGGLEIMFESKRGNKLYRQEREFVDVHRGALGALDADEQVRYYLVYACPSTGKLYVSGVPNDLDYKQDKLDPDRAMGWKWGLTLEEYNSIEIEA